MALPKASGFRGQHGLGVVRTVPQFREFLGGTAGLTAAQRATLVDQAEILIRDLYVHLPLKRAGHAIAPVQRLRLLRHRLDQLKDWEFHVELRDIFVELRDLHTNYVLPDPYRGRFAFLGILLERYHEAGMSRWLVSKVARHLVTDDALQSGVVVTHWNGMPMNLAVWRNADKEAGSNLAARFARGLENLTLRPLAVSLPPDEDWVDLRYETDGQVHESRLLWRVFDSGQELLAGAPDPQGSDRTSTDPAALRGGGRSAHGGRAAKQEAAFLAGRDKRGAAGGEVRRQDAAEYGGAADSRHHSYIPPRRSHGTNRGYSKRFLRVLASLDLPHAGRRHQCLSE